MATDWWLSFYGDEFADTLLADAEPRAARSAAFLVEKLRLSPGMRVFDQCCGRGRISHALARLGMRTIGVDAAEGYVTAARAIAARESLDCAFHVGDAFEFVPFEPVDAAVNWYTSFGYTPDDARNARMLQRNMGGLKPGGWFALDYYNTVRMLQSFEPRLERRHPRPGGDALVVRDASLDLERGMIDQRWSFQLAHEPPVIQLGSTRLYLPHALRELVLQAGFTNVELYGDDDGSPLSSTSPRCIVVAQKSE